METQGAGAGIDAIGVALFTIITSVAISKVSGGIATALSGSSDNDRDKMYDEIHRKISGSHFNLPRPDEESHFNLPRPEEEQEDRGAAVPRTIERPKTMELVNQAVVLLEQAKETTRCGVCRQKLDIARRGVITQAKVVEVSDAKWKIMQDLKDAGKIPRAMRWDQMTPEQKRVINKKVENGVRV